MNYIKEKINKLFEGDEPYQIASKTVLAVALSVYGNQFYQVVREKGLKRALGDIAVYLSQTVPGVSGAMESRSQEAIKEVEKMMLSREDQKDTFKHESIPDKGIENDVLLNKLNEWALIEKSKWDNGSVSGGIYHGGQDLVNICAEAYRLYCITNPLHPEVFPFVRKMESEVIRMCLNLFNADDNACGCMTSGGTESIMLAMKAYRDWGLKEKGIKNAEIVIPITAHAAFDKSAQAFGMKVVKVNVDKDFKVNLDGVRRAINKNTVCIVGSTPNYPQGTIDPIEELSKIALEHKIGLHVDCCLGSLLIPFVESLGYDIPKFDFRVAGVTSMSADTHKFGYAPKGSSVIMYRNSSLRKYQYFMCLDWTGGMYATATIAGSRPGGIVAACWTAMMAMGKDGYTKCAKAIMNTATEIKHGLSNIDGICVLGDPKLSVIAFDIDKSSKIGKKLNIFKLAASLSANGWHLNTLQNPGSIHICVTYVHCQAGYVEKFLQGVRDSIVDVIQNGDKYSDQAQLYGLADALPNAPIVDTVATEFLNCLFKTKPMYQDE